MRRIPGLRRAPGLILALGLLTAGCDTGPVAPFHPVITNRSDNFELDATGLSDLTTIVEYVWQNTGSVASVTQASTVISGTATLDLLDGAGNVVYSRSLAESGTFSTDQGTAGPWVVRLALTRVIGTLGFQARKA